jgi:DNA-directed RNA polymerase I, II, and III subunit RPABC2
MAAATTAPVKKHPLDHPSITEVLENYNPSKNVTKNVLSLYEKTSMLSIRMEQLANGAPTYVDTKAPEYAELRGNNLLRKISEKELFDRKIPLMVRRRLPNGQIEYWRLEDMLIF